MGRPLLAAWYGGLGLALLAAQPHRTRRWWQAVANLPARVKSLRQGGPPGNSQEPAGDTGRAPIPLPGPYITATVAVALGIAAALLWFRTAGGPDGLLHVHFLDVGQGDSVLVVTPSGRKVLVDGGPNGDVVSQQLAEALPGWDRELALVVMTHLDEDHSHGLLRVLERFPVGTALSGPLPTEGAAATEWRQTLEEQSTPRVEVSAGYVIDLGDGVELTVLNPEPGRAPGDPNNDSLAMRLDYGESSFLLTADIEAEVEGRLVSAGLVGASTVLKVGHHGSRTSTSARFLEAVKPSVAIVSSGADNPYGHPADEVMQRLEASLGEENVFRTDRQGRIEVLSDGASIWVETQR